MCPICCKWIITKRSHAITCSPDCRKAWALFVKRFDGDKEKTYLYLSGWKNKKSFTEKQIDMLVKGMMDGTFSKINSETPLSHCVAEGRTFYGKEIKGARKLHDSLWEVNTPAHLKF